MCECKGHSGSSVSQTLGELDFERGLWFAAQYNDLERAHHLLSKNLDVDQRDSGGYTPLHYAARNGHHAMCKLLLERGACIDAVTGAGQATALHRSAAAGKLEIVRFLVDKKANCRLKDGDGKTALHRAASNNHAEVCVLLVEVEPHLKHQKDKKGNKPGDYTQNHAIAALLLN